MHATLVIPARFRGPPASANGGYTAGSLAAWLDGPAEVTLRRPPPIDRPLDVEVDTDQVTLLDGGELIAEARRAVVDVEPPRAVTVDEAAAAAEHSRFRRAPGDTSSPATQSDQSETQDVAPAVESAAVQTAAWRELPGGMTVLGTMPATMEAGFSRTLPSRQIVWSALDCPSSFAMYLEEDPLEGPFVLGRLAARIDAPVSTGMPHVVLGWRVGLDGRKLFAGSALYDASGTPLAVARATWIHV